MHQNRFLIFLLSTIALAELPVRASTQGDNLLGIGPASRALAGNGSAAPQEALAAITQNPSGLDGLPSPAEAGLSTTFFLPHVSTRVGAQLAASAEKTYLIPALSLVGARNGNQGPWTYGFAIFGVSGLGVDYRRTAVDTPLGATPFPLVAGVHTQLQVLEVAPALAYRISPEWSIGASFRVDRGSLDLGGGAKAGLGAGFQPGVTYRPSEQFALSLSYSTPVAVNYRAVTDLDGDGTADNLKLAAPQQFRLGIAWTVSHDTLLVADLLESAWARAAGYGDFGWRNTAVFGVGIQHNLAESLALRVGYTLGESPVQVHNGWDGTAIPANTTRVQGKYVNNYYYETFRVVGFPAIIDRHLGVGLSYRINAGTTLEASYTRAFSSSITEQGKNPLGSAVTLSSRLSEDSLDLGIGYRF